MDILEIVFSNPALTVTLTVLVLGAVNWQRGLTYRELRLAHIVKCRVFSILDPWARKRGRPLVNEANDADYERTIDANARTVSKAIMDVFDPHLVATAKRRTSGWTHSQWVQIHGDGLQTEVYLFRNPDGTTDVYVQVETAVTDPEGHLEDEQTHGDARGAFASAWEDA